MEMTWSRWFHCESSFGLLLVPSQPGVFALAEEVVQAVGPQSRRMLAVFEVAEAEDLSRAMSRLFAAGSPWREKMAQAKVYVRYAIAPSIADRRAAATALKNWLSTQREVASQIFEKPVSVPSEFELAIAPTQVVAKPEPITQASSEGVITVAERAVDRVTHGVKLGKAVPAGF
jgi:hypothetical protein